MNKSAIKNFAIWARNKLIADIQYRAGLMGIMADGIRPALSQSTRETEFYDIGTAEPYAIRGDAVKQRRSLVEAIHQKANETSYQTAYKYIMEGVAYTWFNRLIAVRFMEINDYLPSHIRVLSSDSGKMEPDLVTAPFDADLDFTEKEKQEIVRLKNENRLDECFRLLFIKQCNALNEILPALFEKTADYTELLLNISAIDKEGVVYHLVNDIPEEDFNVEKGGQVEIIGWLYQYYNTEPKNEAFAKSGKITKEEIPAVTQLFTPDWIVRYMVENSLGRLWVEGHPNDLLKSRWKYYLEEAEQERSVQAKLEEIHNEYAKLNPEDIHFIDPCMGSGHILVYAFEVLMQIYESAGYSQREAAKSILENNLYGLDIDDRAYQMAYFAVMMKARQYNRRILSAETRCSVYSIQESNHINRNQFMYFGVGLGEAERNEALNQMNGLLDTFRDAKEYGSILNVESYDWELLRKFVRDVDDGGQLTLDAVGLGQTQERLRMLIDIGEVMARKYEVVVTNPPYMGNGRMNSKLSAYVKKRYPNSKTDMSTVCMEKNLDFCTECGYISMINIPVWMTQSSFCNLRRILLAVSTISSLVHFGRGIFGSDFGTVAFSVYKSSVKGYHAPYFRLFHNLTQVETIEIKEERFNKREGRFISTQLNYEQIDTSPIAYWVTDKQLQAFQHKPLSLYASPRQGFATGSNDVFLRLWHEVSFDKIGLDKKNADDARKSKRKWFPCNKGGEFRKWYGNNSYVVDWFDDGSKMKKFDGSVIRNYSFYFREGMTWSTATMSKLSMRHSPQGFLFESKGSVCFPNDASLLNYLLGIMNSKIVETLLLVLAPTVDYHEGPIGRIPVIVNEAYQVKVEGIVTENIQISKSDWNSFETAWDFMRHPLVGAETKGRLIADKYKEWQLECDKRFNQLKVNEKELNCIFIDTYSLQDELTPEVEDKDITVRKADLQRDIKGLVSYAVGCMFGRYSLDIDGLAFAGGNWDESKYSTFIPDKDNIIPITDEEYFEDDILGLFCGWLKKVYGTDTLEQNLDFIAAALGNKGNTSRDIIRSYFVNDFFKEHCITYSITGSGKRPIYWLFDSGKQNGFKALVYLHRYNVDTVGNLRVDYLHRMQRIYESEISRMQDMIDNSTNSREVGVAAKRKEKLLKQLKECLDYDEKIAHLALSRIELDLDDGVKVNYRKLQTAKDGKFYEVLADSKIIMAKEK